MMQSPEGIDAGQADSSIGLAGCVKGSKMRVSGRPRREVFLTRAAALPVILLAWLGSPGCVGRLHSETQPKWTTGFWYWNGNAADAAPARAIPDLLYVHAGTIWRYGSRTVPDRWSVSGELPDSLPPAREYWLVFRKEEPGVPDVSAAMPLAQQVVRLQETARRRQLKLAGAQLDIDCPTGQLPQYAEFLREVRKTIPPELAI